jgi:hypothetical protein
MRGSLVPLQLSQSSQRDKVRRTTETYNTGLGKLGHAERSAFGTGGQGAIIKLPSNKSMMGLFLSICPPLSTLPKCKA